jgi:hypothetical protein
MVVSVEIRQNLQSRVSRIRGRLHDIPHRSAIDREESCEKFSALHWVGENDWQQRGVLWPFLDCSGAKPSFFIDEQSICGGLLFLSGCARTLVDTTSLQRCSLFFICSVRLRLQNEKLFLTTFIKQFLAVLHKKW